MINSLCKLMLSVKEQTKIYDATLIPLLLQSKLTIDEKFDIWKKCAFKNHIDYIEDWQLPWIIKFNEQDLAEGQCITWLDLKKYAIEKSIPYKEDLIRYNIGSYRIAIDI